MLTELDIWRYLAINHIHPNPLYQKGYRSIDCEPCTQKEKDEADSERAGGRWAGTKKKWKRVRYSYSDIKIKKNLIA